jgi:hypothetical protein
MGNHVYDRCLVDQLNRVLDRFDGCREVACLPNLLLYSKRDRLGREKTVSDSRHAAEAPRASASIVVTAIVEQLFRHTMGEGPFATLRNLSMSRCMRCLNAISEIPVRMASTSAPTPSTLKSVNNSSSAGVSHPF